MWWKFVLFVYVWGLQGLLENLVRSMWNTPPWSPPVPSLHKHLGLVGFPYRQCTQKWSIWHQSGMGAWKTAINGANIFGEQPLPKGPLPNMHQNKSLVSGDFLPQLGTTRLKQNGWSAWGAGHSKHVLIYLTSDPWPRGCPLTCIKINPWCLVVFFPLGLKNGQSAPSPGGGVQSKRGHKFGEWLLPKGPLPAMYQIKIPGV